MSARAIPVLAWPIPTAAVALIVEREGMRLKAYRCPAGKWTCGLGETDGVTPTTEWTEDEAYRRLFKSLTVRSIQVSEALTEPASPNQLGALVSLQYNIGHEAFLRSTVRKCHNRTDWQAAARAFSMWDKATVDGKLTTLAGLTARRAAEAALYLAPESDAPQEPMPQAVEAETPLAQSTTMKSGATVAGAGVVTGLSEVSGQIGGMGDVMRSAKSVLVDTLGIPVSWILPLVLCVAAYILLRDRIKRRMDGWI